MPKSGSDSAFAGALSGFASRAMVQPLDVLKIRLQLQVEPLKAKAGKYHGVIQTLFCIYKEEGFRGLWKGHATGQMHAISFSMIQFYSYGLMNNRYKESLNRKYTKSEDLTKDFVFGSLSGIISITSTQPLDILRTRLVAQGEPRQYSSLHNAISNIVKKEGFLTLYRGWLPSVLIITPQTGLQFLFYNISNTVINNIIAQLNVLDDVNGFQIGVIQSIIAGGFAGIFSKICVYPLDIVKKRMQIQGFEEARKKFGKLHTSSGFVNCFKVIYNQEGIQAFTKGLKPSLLKAFISIGLKFSVYEQACRFMSTMRSSNQPL